jgi:hypothetical protein
MAAVIRSHVEGSLSLGPRDGIDLCAAIEKEGDDLRMPFRSRVVQRGETFLISGIGVRSGGKQLADDGLMAQVCCDVKRSDASVETGVGIGAVGEQQLHETGVAVKHGEEQGCRPGGRLAKIRGHTTRQKLCDSPEVPVPGGEEELLIQGRILGLSIHAIRG